VLARCASNLGLARKVMSPAVARSIPGHAPDLDVAVAAELTAQPGRQVSQLHFLGSGGPCGSGVLARVHRSVHLGPFAYGQDLRVDAPLDPRLFQQHQKRAR